MKTELEVLKYVLLNEGLGDFFCVYTDEIDEQTIELCYEGVSGQLYDVLVTDTEDSIEVKIEEYGIFLYAIEPEELVKTIHKALVTAHREESNYKETLEIIYRRQVYHINGDELEPTQEEL